MGHQGTGRGGLGGYWGQLLEHQGCRAMAVIRVSVGYRGTGAAAGVLGRCRGAEPGHILGYRGIRGYQWGTGWYEGTSGQFLGYWLV